MQIHHAQMLPALKVLLVVVILSCGTLTTPVIAAEDKIVRTSAGISYVSGGIGTESVSRLSAIRKDFNLKLVFALESGSYVSDVQIRINDRNGNALLDTLSSGPWFLAQLPSGRYQLVATFSGTPIKQQFTIATTAMNTMHLQWADD